MNDKILPKFWWVNQGSTYDEALKGGFIWAPKINKSGAPVFHWENVSRVKAGDFIFHYADGEIRAISQAKSDSYDAKKALGGDEWSDDGWRVDADYSVLTKPLSIESIGPIIANLHLDKGPVNKSGGVNQGYLYEIPPIATSMLIAQMDNDPALQASKIAQLSIAVASDRPVTNLFEIEVGWSNDLEISEIRANKALIRRFVSAVLSKRFLILTGLAGSGKTKIAQAFARWITPGPNWCDDADHSKGKNLSPYYALIPVGADWTGNENIIGYPDGLQPENYITKPALELIRRAVESANSNVPHFLILDEMNLSHVERYFADLLSAIESGEEIPLYEGQERLVNDKPVQRKLRLPDNLFVIGTVNVDETTYMFSPKVLDRANVIEFRMELGELATFLSSPKAPKLEELDGKGAAFGNDFVEAAADKTRQVPASVKKEFEQEMILFFNVLRKHNAEFGYRTSYEAARFVHFYKLLGGYSDDNNNWFKDAMDAVIVQKFLPKLHGSRSKLEGLLWALMWACGADRANLNEKDFAAQIHQASLAEDEGKYGPDALWSALEKKNPDDPAEAARYPLSFDKLMRMYQKLVRDQFVSFAEA